MSLVPLWAKALIVAAVAAAALWALHLWKESLREDGREEIRAEWARDRAAQAAAALKQAAANAAETERRLRAQKEITDAAERDLAAARRDADAADALAGRLRTQLAARTAAVRGAAGDPAAAGQCAATLDALYLYADLFERADKAAGELARHADASRAAGLACERAFDSLTPP